MTASARAALPTVSSILLARTPAPSPTRRRNAAVKPANTASSRNRLREGQGEHHRPHQELGRRRLLGKTRPPHLLRRVRLAHRPRPGGRAAHHRHQGRHALQGDQADPEAGTFLVLLWPLIREGGKKRDSEGTATDGVGCLGHRDLDRWQAALLPGAPRQALQAYARVISDPMT